MTLLQYVVSCNRIKTKEQKKSDIVYIYIVKMYHKASFISIRNDFGIYLPVHYSEILLLMKSIGIL